MATSVPQLLEYFETGDKPTQEQFAELINAFRHKDDGLSIADIVGLQGQLDALNTLIGTLTTLLGPASQVINGPGGTINIAVDKLMFGLEVTSATAQTVTISHGVKTILDKAMTAGQSYPVSYLLSGGASGDSLDVTCTNTITIKIYLR